MAKVTDLSDPELDAMITKHEKTLQLLMKEKARRTGKPVGKTPEKSKPLAEPESNFQVVIDEEIMAKVAQPKAEEKKDVLVAVDPEDETANMRLTRVLKLSKDELAKFNKAVEKKNKN